MEPTFLYDKRRHINQQMRSFMEVKQKNQDALLPLLDAITQSFKQIKASTI